MHVGPSLLSNVTALFDARECVIVVLARNLPLIITAVSINTEVLVDVKLSLGVVAAPGVISEFWLIL